MPAPEGIDINSWSGSIFGEAIRQVDGIGVRSGGRIPSCIAVRPARDRTDLVWRLGAVRPAFRSNSGDSFQRSNRLQEVAVLLGSHGRRLRDVALRPGFVDLLRSFPASGYAKPVRRGCDPFSACSSNDGGAGPAAAP